MEKFIYYFKEFIEFTSYLMFVRAIKSCIAVFLLVILILAIKKILSKTALLNSPGLAYYFWLIPLAGFLFWKSAVFDVLTDTSFFHSIAYVAAHPIVHRIYFLLVFTLLLRQLVSRFILKYKFNALQCYTDEKGVFIRAKELCNVHKRKIVVKISSEGGSPLSFGIRKPYIILPADYAEKYNEKELFMIFLHELNHIKNGDLIIYRGLEFLQAIWWFQPFSSKVIEIIKGDMECFCDYRTITIGGEDICSYGMAVLKSVPIPQKSRKSYAVLGMVQSKKHLNERIMYIAQFQKLSRASKAAAKVIICLMLCGSVILAVRFHSSMIEYNCLVAVRDYNEVRQLTEKDIENLQEKSLKKLLPTWELNDIVEITETTFKIDGDKLQTVMKKYNVTETELCLDVELYSKENIIFNGGLLTINTNDIGKNSVELSLFNDRLDKLFYLAKKYI